MEKVCWVVWMAVALLIFSLRAQAEITPREYSVEITTTAPQSPGRVDLVWRADTNATQYIVSRKLPFDGNWIPLGTVGGQTNTFADTDVQTNVVYEYQVQKSASAGYSGSGYISAGQHIQPTEYRGKLILLVDSTVAAPLASELARFRQDLVGDGWTVVQHEVSRDAPVAAVKSLIVAEYHADPQNVRCLVLFGHIPVPYSGDYAPDDHENHRGAWPAAKPKAGMRPKALPPQHG